MPPELREARDVTVIVVTLLLLAPAALLVAMAVKGALAGEREAFVFFGPALILGAVGALVLRPLRWYRRCAEVHGRGRSRPLRLHLVTNSRGGLFLELHPLVDVLLRDPIIRVQSERRPKGFRRLEGETVRVFLDDDPEGPVVVETSLGLLWSPWAGRRTNRPEGQLH
jgi:hypothetical protein